MLVFARLYICSHLWHFSPQSSEYSPFLPKHLQCGEFLLCLIGSLICRGTLGAEVGQILVDFVTMAVILFFILKKNLIFMTSIGKGENIKFLALIFLYLFQGRQGYSHTSAVDKAILFFNYLYSSVGRHHYKAISF